MGDAPEAERPELSANLAKFAAGLRVPRSAAKILAALNAQAEWEHKHKRPVAERKRTAEAGKKTAKARAVRGRRTGERYASLRQAVAEKRSGSKLSHDAACELVAKDMDISKDTVKRACRSGKK